MRRRPGLLVLTLFLIVLAIRLIPAILGEGGTNLHLLQAEAFLEGRITLSEPLHDVAVYSGNYYVPFPPLPTLVLVPFVALFGTAGVNVTVIALALAVLGGWFLYELLDNHVADRRNVTVWLTAGFLAGTPFYMVLLKSSGVWYFSHVVAVTFLLAALREAFVGKRGWTTGLSLGFAFLSRPLTIFACPFVFYLLAERGEGALPKKARRVTVACTSLVVCCLALLIFNEARFGTPLELGYSHIPLEGFLAERVERYGLFSLAYLPFNLSHLFLQGFHLEFGGTTRLFPVEVDPFGTSIFLASPFVIGAFLSRFSRREGLAWLGVISMVIVSSLYYNNGWVQPNAQRFTLDYWPLLIILVGWGLRSRAREHNLIFWKAFIAYALFLNVVSFVGVPVLNRLVAGNLL